ncbi:hypothetical protein HYH03_001705 [Edaphochlamys debaryana]|uniref:AAA+ ATPase domain-containing protein n=1 Tax=Edaphochlamys debaryana TaxID=47281 RepID=A0A835YF78_9CHLO|nr:hypothetical protein HYH03_001705 [Edaphochlamys debaryana]|eukprot:KAG2500123.1 hypothetical protein HYH03_001705 [Edaphochlamys debaryana]
MARTIVKADLMPGSGHLAPSKRLLVAEAAAITLECLAESDPCGPFFVLDIASGLSGRAAEHYESLYAAPERFAGLLTSSGVFRAAGNGRVRIKLPGLAALGPSKARDQLLCGPGKRPASSRAVLGKQRGTDGQQPASQQAARAAPTGPRGDGPRQVCGPKPSPVRHARALGDMPAAAACVQPGQQAHALLPLASALRLTIGPDRRGLVSEPTAGAEAAADPRVRRGPEEWRPAAAGAAACGGGGGQDAQLEAFLPLLPPGLRDAVRGYVAAAKAGNSTARCPPPPLLVDLAVDAGRDVRLAFSDGSKRTLEGVKVDMESALAQLVAHVNDLRAQMSGPPGGTPGKGGDRPAKRPRSEAAAAAPTVSPAEVDRCFGSDCRCCPPGTLHRVSALRDPRSGRVIGLTYRVGRHLPGVAGPLADVLADLAGRGRAWAQAGAEAGRGSRRSKTAQHLAGSLLLLGRPGSGKTTLLRDIAAHLSDGLGLGVVVVDTSNEIAGGDALPHACIGSARRLMVGPRHRLAEAMIEAVQNHGPQVIVVDEIANAAEVAAARTIAARGVMLVATAHGTGLRSLMANNQLNSLIGGLQAVTLGDATAQQANNGVKTRTERRGQPVFRTMVEVLGGGRLLLRPDVASSVDAILGASPSSQQWQHGQGGRGLGGPQRAHRPLGPASGPYHRLPPQLPHRASAPAPPRHPPQRPGSLLLLHGSSSGAEEAGGSAGGAAEPLPPLEQLRWTEPGEDALKEGEEQAESEGMGSSRVRLQVRLLELGGKAPEEEEE